MPDGTFLFGSELKSILAHGGLSRDIDPLAVEEYFALGYVAEPRCVFLQAKKLSPAHTFSIRRGQRIGVPKAYWDVRFSLDSRISHDDACQQLTEKLGESIRLRMMSEVPLGAFLSGGVDSDVYKRQLKMFDYGRSKQGTGSYSFKKNWGFEPQPLYYEYCLYKRDSIPQNNPNNAKFRLFIEAWRRLPIGLANWLGPFIVRNLG